MQWFNQALQFFHGHPFVLPGTAVGVTAFALFRPRRKQTKGKTANQPAPHTAGTGATQERFRLVRDRLTGSQYATDAISDRDHRRLVLQLGEVLVESRPGLTDVALFGLLRDQVAAIVNSSFDDNGAALSPAHARSAVRLVKLLNDGQSDNLANNGRVATSVSAALLVTQRGHRATSSELGTALQALLLERVNFDGFDLPSRAYRVVRAFQTHVLETLTDITREYQAASVVPTASEAPTSSSVILPNRIMPIETLLPENLGHAQNYGGLNFASSVMATPTPGSPILVADRPLPPSPTTHGRPMSGKERRAARRAEMHRLKQLNQPGRI